jgi:hypothetical protein
MNITLLPGGSEQSDGEGDLPQAKTNNRASAQTAHKTNH